MVSAIVAFLLLFATFAVGLRCFSDFDKGLQTSKLHGQSYKLVNQKPAKVDLFDDDGDSPDVTSRKKKYSSTPAADKLGEHDKNEQQQMYPVGHQLEPRMSIE